ncbi:hypothetical protein ACHAPJ_009033 [Fusarium lateritium]
MAPNNFTDVLICGAGPVGVIVALGLAQQGIDTICIEKREPGDQEKYGRACTLYARSLELLETVRVTDELLQAGFLARYSTNYKDGKRVTARGWNTVLSSLSSSFHDYLLNLRQSCSQAILAARYTEDFAEKVFYEWMITDYQIDTSIQDGYNVTVNISHLSEGDRTVRCKYLIGADGGSSVVRRIADIPRLGDDTAHRWIRMDAKIKTDMPDPDGGLGSIETKEHGNVLWVKLDRDAHRIGFALRPNVQAAYPDGPTEEVVIAEAIETMKPFKLEVERLDWWTSYGLLVPFTKTSTPSLQAIDAGHTHSSGLAQGMNTGIHDATNLIWKLSGTLKGWYTPRVLETYDSERHVMAEKIIKIDKLIADAISGNIPQDYAATGATPEESLHQVLQANMGFTVGLDVQYQTSLISLEPTVSPIQPGRRSPDSLVRAPGPAIPIRLHTITHSESRGRWTVIVLTGNYHANANKIAALRNEMQASGSIIKRREKSLQMVTLILGTVNSAWDALAGPAIGNFYCDTEGLAHGRFGISAENGGIVIIRPDGVFGSAFGLEEMQKTEASFGRIFV